RELDAQGMDGPRGWSGNPQRLSVRGRGGGSFAGQPAILARNQEAITSRFTQSSAITQDMVRVARYLWDEKLALMAKVFPRVRKPMHTHRRTRSQASAGLGKVGRRQGV